MLIAARGSGAPWASATRPRIVPPWASSRFGNAISRGAAQSSASERRFTTGPPRAGRRSSRRGAARSNPYAAVRTATPQEGSPEVRAFVPKRTPGPGTRVRFDRNSVIEAERGSHRSRLVSQVAHAGASAPLPVQGEQGPLVGHVVEEDRNLPVLTGQADAQVEKIVSRQLRIEREQGIRQRPADGLSPGALERRQRDCPKRTVRRVRRPTLTPAVVVVRREVRAHVLVAAADEGPRSRAHLPLVRGASGRLDLRHRGQAGAVLNARDDRRPRGPDGRPRL